MRARTSSVDVAILLLMLASSPRVVVQRMCRREEHERRLQNLVRQVPLTAIRAVVESNTHLFVPRPVARRRVKLRWRFVPVNRDRRPDTFADIRCRDVPA